MVTHRETCTHAGRTVRRAGNADDEGGKIRGLLARRQGQSENGVILAAGNRYQLSEIL